jgi:purine-nucleoside phosphorylase
MSSAATALNGALCVAFTGKISGFQQMSAYGADLVALVRQGAQNKTLVIIDQAVGMPLTQTSVVRDHLNLTGTNPLIGPNDPSGARFPVVQGIYVEDALANLPKIVVAGLKQGLLPNDDDCKAIKQLGAHAACYNIVPSMLICAHAGWRVLAVLVPAGQQPPDEILQAIEKLTGDKA